MTQDSLLDGYARRKEVDRPHEAAYFRRFPLRPDERELAGQAFKLVADYGLAEGVHTAMRGATEAVFEEQCRAEQRIESWTEFLDEILLRVQRSAQK